MSGITSPGPRLAASLLLLTAVWVLLTPVATASDTSEHPYNLGCEALARGNVAKAKTLFEQAVKLDSSDTDALNNLAVCEIMTGEYDRALPLLRKVLRLNARYSGADLNIGAAYVFQEDLTRAERPTDRATRGGTTAAGKQVEASAYYNLGLIAARQGRFEEAKSAFTRSAKAQSTVRAQIGLGSSLCALGDFATGLPMLERIETADEETAGILKADLAAAYYQSGIAKLGNGDLAGAEGAFDRSTRAAVNDYARMGEALVLAERGDRGSAAILLEDLKASATSPTIKRAAGTNLKHLADVSDSSSGWLQWLVMAAGALLFAFQAYVLIDILSAWRRSSAAVWRAVIGIVVGLVAAGALVYAFADPFRSPLWVGAVLAIDLVVVVVLWSTTRSSSMTPTA